MRTQSGSGFSVFLIMLLVIIGFGALLWMNTKPAAPVVPVVPTEFVPTDESETWQQILREGFGSNSTPLPTPAVSQQEYVPPTLALSVQLDATPVQASDLGGATAVVAIGATPTLPAPSPTEDQPIVAQVVTQNPIATSPPSLIPVISRDPLGRDHFVFIRPVDSRANNAVLFYYPYGSDGPQKDNPLRVHHGIDMPNPIGQVVRAAGSGEVVWASDGLRTEDGVFENSPAYGNVIVIKHDFGYDGQPLWTLYAHLSAALVVRGQYVQMGDVIGLSGNSGRVSGPHLHFEVRMGENRYRSTYNPVLWITPYVNTGVIAGRVTDQNGNLLNDVDITVRNWATGTQQDTTTTYVYLDNGSDVNADPKWGENFVVADVPVGRYQVIVNLSGQRIVKLVDVYEGMTSFVELKPDNPPTAQPVTDTP